MLGVFLCFFPYRSLFLSLSQKYTHAPLFLNSAPGTSTINHAEGSWKHRFSRHHSLCFLFMLLYMRLHTHTPFQHKTAQHTESRERKTPEKALQEGTPKSVASGIVFIENKQHNWTDEKRRTDSDGWSSAPSASWLVWYNGCLSVEAKRGSFIQMMAFGLSQLSASQDGNKERKKFLKQSKPRIRLRIYGFRNFEHAGLIR